MSAFRFEQAGRTPQGVRGLKYTGSCFLTRSSSSHPARGAWIEMAIRAPARTGSAGSHPARGAWIEISCGCVASNALTCRTPQGVRGLKFSGNNRRTPVCESHPARGAWIEIPALQKLVSPLASRTPQGVRGLKYRAEKRRAERNRRTPQGVRGLK